jgi:hypothetical protein
MLKVRIISSCETWPRSRRCSKMGSTGQEPSSICAPVPLGRMRGRFSVMPPPVMCAMPTVSSRGDQLLDHVQVAAVGFHQGRAGLLLDGGDVLRGLVAGNFKQELAGQRIAVGVQAGGGQSDEHVAGLDADAGNHFVAIDGADDEAGQVVFAFGIEAGHLGGFAADEGAAVGLAGFGQTGDHASVTSGSSLPLAR